MSFEESDPVNAIRIAGGWRRLEAPQSVRCYVASTWTEAIAVDVNDRTREICIEFGTPVHGMRRVILEPSLYEPTPALFP